MFYAVLEENVRSRKKSLVSAGDKTLRGQKHKPVRSTY